MHRQIITRITLSPAQALLILIEHYRFDLPKLAQLKRCFFLGAQTLELKQAINNFLQDPILDAYSISRTSHVIDTDPSRRYFETHLARETLLSHINSLDSDALFKHLNNIARFFNEPEQAELFERLNGNYEGDNDITHYHLDAIQEITRGETFKCMQSNRLKLAVLMQISLATIMLNNKFDLTLPLTELRTTEMFRPTNRGREEKANQKKVLSSYFGLMRSYMPLSTEDEAYGKRYVNDVRPADCFTYQENAKWPKWNFSLLVHPYSASISGTIATQLRTLKALADKGELVFDNRDKLLSYFRIFIALLLFQSGSHSFFEFTSPLLLDEIHQAFSFMNGFDSLNMETLFFIDNELAFNNALEKTLKYNRKLIQEKKVQLEIKSHGKDELQTLLVKITNCISSYKGHKDFVARFYFNLGLIDWIENDKEEIKQQLRKAVTELEKENKNYYQGFFSKVREKNSQLALKIEEAKRLLP